MHFRSIGSILREIKRSQSGFAPLKIFSDKVLRKHVAFFRNAYSSRNNAHLGSQTGFTLVELLIYAVIFSIASGLLTGILVTISNVQVKENAAFEVTRQLQFVTQKIQYAIRDASIVDAVYEGTDTGTSCSTFCSVRLRVADPALDPTIISSDVNGVYLKEGANSQVTLTSPSIKITSLTFGKVANPGGITTVSVDLALTYSSADASLQIAKSLSSAIAHVSAATFDTDLLPDAAGSRSIGLSSSTWKDLTVSEGIKVYGTAGVGEIAGLTMQKSTTHGSSSINQYYVTASPYDKYGARFDVGGTPMLYLEGDINQAGRRAYFLNGNVGVGTTNPLAKLHSYISSSGVSSVSANADALVLEEAGNTGISIFTPNTATASIRFGDPQDNGAGVIQYTHTTNQMDLHVNSSDTLGITILSSGNTGIGNTSPSYTLDVSGDLRITGTPYRTGGDIAWQIPSDARLKNITGKFNYGISDINKLDVVKFHYREGNELGISSDKEYTGLIAQDVQKVIPEAVSEDHGYLTLNSTPIIWTMLNSIKELSAENEVLKETVKDFNRRIGELENKCR